MGGPPHNAGVPVMNSIADDAPLRTQDGTLKTQSTPCPEEVNEKT